VRARAAWAVLGGLVVAVRIGEGNWLFQPAYSSVEQRCSLNELSAYGRCAALVECVEIPDIDHQIQNLIIWRQKGFHHHLGNAVRQPQAAPAGLSGGHCRVLQRSDLGLSYNSAFVLLHKLRYGAG
jgi:hypothetical protein